MKHLGVLNRVVDQCGKVVNEKQENLTVLFERRMRKKAVRIAVDQSHSLSQLYELLPSERRYRVPKVKTVGTKKSFIPLSILALNK